MMRKRPRFRRVRKKKTNKRLGGPGRSERGASKLFSLKGALTGVVFAFAVFSGLWFRSELLESPYLKVETVEIRGTRVVTEEEVLELSGIYRGRNILGVSPRKAVELLRTHPYIEYAKVARRLPGTVYVDIVEREPLALVAMRGEGLVVMDKKGTLFKNYSPADLAPGQAGLDLVVVTGAEDMREEWQPVLRPKLLTLIMALERGSTLNMENVSEIHFDPVYGFTVVTLDGGIRVEMGAGNFKEKILNLERVAAARRGGLGGVENVNLDDERGVVLRFAAT